MTHPTATDRDYATEMRTLIDKATAGREVYVAAAVASQLVEELRVNDPELLDGWLHAQAVTFVREAVAARDRSMRAHARFVAPGRAFRQAAKRFRDGDRAAFRYLDLPFTVEGNVHKPLRALQHDDLMFVRNDYQARVDENRFYVTLMGTLAKKVTTGTVADHYTEEQLAAMFGPLPK